MTERPNIMKTPATAATTEASGNIVSGPTYKKSM
jgi:hypothetical protein